jgi:hypothetical protein
MQARLWAGGLGVWSRVGGQRAIGSASAIGTIIRNRKTLTVRIVFDRWGGRTYLKPHRFTTERC